MPLTLNEISDIVRDASAAALERLDPRARATAEAAIFSGFSAAIRANPKNMSYMLSVSEASVAQCVTAAAITGIYPTGTASTGAYLVPTDGQLCYRLTHRGYAALARRVGLIIHAVPVGTNDLIEVNFDEVAAHRRADLSKNPTSLDEMLGVYVTIHDTNTGIVLRPWVPISVAHRAKSSSKATKGPNPWNNDACQMAIGACVRYLVLRGTIAISGEAGAAIAAADRADAIDAESEPVAQPRRVATIAAPPIAALPGPTQQRQLAATIEAEWVPPPADIVPTQAPEPTQTRQTRATTWATPHGPAIVALARAMGRPTPRSAEDAAALLVSAGITAPDTMPAADLATAIAEAAVQANERAPDAR